MFDTTSPIMSGWWYNPRTGDSFQVRDCYFDNGDYKVQTMDGRLLSYSQVEQYVQSEKPIAKQPKVNPAVTENKNLAKQAAAQAGATDIIERKPVAPQIPKETIDDYKEDIPSSILNELDDVDVIEQPVKKAVEAPKPTKSVNYEMIDRAIGPKMEQCSVEAQCKWGVVSEDEIKVLVNMMKVEVDEIAEYIYEKKCSKEQILQALKENINFILND